MERKKERERWKRRGRQREREKDISRQVASALSEPAPYVLKIFPRYEPNEVAAISDFPCTTIRLCSCGLPKSPICLRETLMGVINDKF